MLVKRKIETYGDILHHQKTKRLDDYGDCFFTIEVQNLKAERILDSYRRGKYYLVKWQNLDYSESTWEPTYFVNKHFVNLRFEYLRIVQTQELINDNSDIGKHYRYDLMKSRDLYTSIQPFTAFTETPSFLRRSGGRELHEY